MRREAMTLALSTSVMLAFAETARARPQTELAERAGEAAPVAVHLDELLAFADGRAPQIVRSHRQLSFGVAAIAAARPWVVANPTVGAALGARTNRVGTAFEVQLTVSQQLEIAGERKTRRLAAGAYSVSLHRKLDQSRFETRIHVRSLFALAVLARERLDTAARIRDFTSSTVRHARARVDAGELSPLRLHMAEVALTQATQAHLEAARAYRAACRDLATRAGWPATVPIDPIGELAHPIAASAVDALVPAALADHPELVALGSAVDAAQAGVRAARREGWPEPTLGGYVAREHPPGTPFADYVGLLTISVPLPVWRRNQGERARADAALRVVQTELALRRYELTQRIHRMVDAVDTAAKRVQGYQRDVLPVFGRNLDQLQRSFELGESDVIEVSVGRQAFLDAQKAALDTWEDYLVALRELELAIGRELEWSPQR